MTSTTSTETQKIAAALAFVQKIAAMKVWKESELFLDQWDEESDPDGQAPQSDIDYLINQDEKLESLIHRARKIIS